MLFIYALFDSARACEHVHKEGEGQRERESRLLAGHEARHGQSQGPEATT